MKSQITQPLFEDLLPGLHKAMFLGREEPREGKFGEFTKWKFAIGEADKVQEYSGITSTKFFATPRCKNYRWACAIDPTLDEKTKEWDDAKFVGTEVTVSLVDQDEPSSGFLNVKDVFPLTK